MCPMLQIFLNPRIILTNADTVKNHTGVTNIQSIKVKCIERFMLQVFKGRS